MSYHKQNLWMIAWISSCFTWGLILTSPVSAQTRAAEFLSDQSDRANIATSTGIATTQAIVQLQGLPLTRPKIQGTTLVPLKANAPLRLLMIEGQVQNQSETFLVDTGASTTLLSKALVKRLQLQGKAISGDRLSSAVAGTDCPTMDANLHQIPPFNIGAVQVNGLQGLEFIETQMPYDLSGILGMNLLSVFDLKIYPKTGQLSLTHPSSSPPQDLVPGKSLWRSPVIPLESRLGVMLAQLKVNEHGPFTFLIDTGAASTFISPKVAQMAQITALPRQDVKVQGFCGLESAYRVMTPTIRLGIYQVQQVDTIVLDSSVINTLKVDGILGQNVLNRFNQHWRFPDSKRPDFQSEGSLYLSPVQTSTR